MDTVTNTDAISQSENAVYGRGLMIGEACRPSRPFADLQIFADLQEAFQAHRGRDEVSERAGLRGTQKAQGPLSYQNRFPEDLEDHTLVGGLPDSPPEAPTTSTPDRAADRPTAASQSSTSEFDERAAAVGREQADGTRGGRTGQSTPQAGAPEPAATAEPLLKGKFSPTLVSGQPAGESPDGGEASTGRLLQSPDSRLKGLQPMNPQAEADAEGFAKPGKAGIGLSAAAQMPSEGTKGGARTQFDVSALSSGESVTSVHRGASQAPAPMSVGAGAGRAPTSNLGEQILDSVRASLAQGDRQVLVRLNPPELGTVFVRLREDDQHISAMLEVARGDTRREIELALPQVLRGLQDAGVPVKKFEVVTSDLPEKDLAHGQTQQDGPSQHQSSGHDRDHLTPASQTHWSQADPGHAQRPADEPAGISQTEFPAGRIDMLL